MDSLRNKLSRRRFLKHSAVALGSIATYDLMTDMIGSEKAVASTVSKIEELKEKQSAHVSVQLWPGRTEQTKQQLAQAIAEDVVNIVGCDEELVSVSIKDVSSEDWQEKVYDPEIRGNMKNIYKKPGYSM